MKRIAQNHINFYVIKGQDVLTKQLNLTSACTHLESAIEHQMTLDILTI